MPDSSAARGVPRLLISVRDCAEATAALGGGCQWLDVKEPDSGALGFAGIDALEMIAGALPTHEIPLSAALGELAEWTERAAPSLPSRVMFAKMGLAGARSHRDWMTDWAAVRTRFDAARPCPLSWVAVAYADHAEANAPRPEEVLAAARSSGCRGFLVDTWGKSGGSVFDWMTPSELRALFDSARESGMLTALAGRLNEAHLPLAARIGPDLIAVRSAACRDGDRANSVDEKAVRALRERLVRG